MTMDDDSDSNRNMVDGRIATNYVHDRYLDAEERYEIFVVKAAECSHLLHWTVDHSTSCKEIEELADNENRGDSDEYDDEKKVDDSMHASASLNATSTAHTSMQSPPPPLTDGCDIPGWRCHRIAPCMNSTHGENSIDIESPLEGTLNIGAGSVLMRRESQFPFISSSLCSLERSAQYHDGHINCWWYSAKQSFNFPPPPERAAPIIHHEDAAIIVDYVTNADVSKNGQRKITMFCKEYEIKNRPVKILGATKGWLAMPCYEQCDDSIAAEQQLLTHDDEGNTGETWRDVGEKSELFSGGGIGGWTFATLLSRFGNVAFRFSDTHGEMMSLHTYAKYITSPEGLSDDSPLGIYDAEFGDDDSPTSVLLDEYSVPECFSDDLFGFVDGSMTDVDGTNDEENGSADLDEEKEQEDTTEISRPPYRWVLIGPERSGTGMHVDPLWTNAWVTVLHGRKRWLLFPPETPYESIGMIDGKPQIRSSIWFRDFYDKVTSSSWPKEYQPVEVLQNPGETVFVPAGWPHLVLNLELTVAVTHNYASEHGPFFERMWEEVAQDEPSFASRWHSGLRKSGREDLACVAPSEIKLES
mmetsp:Transcript_8140/g.18317  ORF Transcript_8140/g.18317 Transcript_8140/m.18317 type:complete len:585 (+) Transcript_8140:531-2285(+)